MYLFNSFSWTFCLFVRNSAAVVQVRVVLQLSYWLIHWFFGLEDFTLFLSLFCSLNKILHGTPDIFPSKALPFPLFPQHFAPDSRTSFLSDAEWQQLQSLSLAFRLHRCESSASACSWNPSFGSFRASSSDKWGGSVHLINEGEVEIENIIRC